MPAVSSSALLLLLGAILFLYAGYSTIQHRDHLKVAKQDFDSVPLHILGTVLLAALSSLWGSYLKAGKLKAISALSGQQGLDANSFRPDFMAFNHRGFAADFKLPYAFTT
ncbi:hypothetical protein WJX73_003715 [Symbiochloris irregularis]|uniref:Membrane magnesium transporter n=1 Tax=Symbiochloris irregularis TaxID=706552 RepID=A0AAW1PI22_9CHLO